MKNAQTITEILKENEIDLRAEAEARTKFDQPTEIVRAGNKIQVPKSMRPEKALETISVWADSESQMISVSEKIDGIPIDAANALALAIKHEYGVVKLESGWWGTPPPFYSVPINAKNDNVDVYVGRFTLPGFENATFETYPNNSEVSPALAVSASLRRKDMPLFKQIVSTAREFLKTHSLYKGKAITVDFSNPLEDRGSNELFVPKFWDVDVDKSLILSDETLATIKATVWTPITHLAEVKEMGTPIKRGILLYGTYGTGKTLTAYATARLAVQHGFTFIYVKKVEYLKRTIDFVSQGFLPAVVFMEDTEKAFENPDKINDIQNTMDGIDGKDRDLIVVLTTNHVQQLPQAIMRPGRLDTVIQLRPADAKTAAKLVKFYAGDMLDPNTDMEAVGLVTQGHIAATIREVVERAKLFGLSRTGNSRFLINHSDIEFAAHGMQEHMALLSSPRNLVPSPVEKFGGAMGAMVADGIRTAVRDMVTNDAFNKVPAKLN